MENESDQLRGGYAASFSASSFAASAGYHRPKHERSSSYDTGVRICSRACAPLIGQRILFFYEAIAHELLDGEAGGNRLTVWEPITEIRIR